MFNILVRVNKAVFSSLVKSSTYIYFPLNEGGGRGGSIRILFPSIQISQVILELEYHNSDENHKPAFLFENAQEFPQFNFILITSHNICTIQVDYFSLKKFLMQRGY